MDKKKRIISRKPDVIFETFYLQALYALTRCTLLKHHFILLVHWLVIQYNYEKICYELLLDKNGYTGYSKCIIIPQRTASKLINYETQEFQQ